MRKFIKRQSLAGNSLYRKWEDWAVEDFLIGKVVGFFTDSYDKVGVKIEVEAGQFEDGSVKDYLKKTVSINSCGSIVKALDKLQEDDMIGEYIEVKYLGTTEVQKGKYKGKDCHIVEINVLEPETDSEGQAEDDL